MSSRPFRATARGIVLAPTVMHDPLAPYCIAATQRVKLDAFQSAVAPASLGSTDLDAERFASLVAAIGALQNRLYAEHRRKVLVILQGMDTSGKDGTISHVFAHTHPLGVRAVAFKEPTPEEIDHDYLWRVHRHVPKCGEIGLFNRSHYEDVVTARVLGHIDVEECKRRYAQINQFERMLTETGTRIVKFYLHISKAEQKLRLQQRLLRPEKHWKFAPSDLADRDRWSTNIEAYEHAIGETASKYAPWWIIPADSKSHRNLMAAEIIHRVLVDLAPAYPPLPAQFTQLTVN